MSLTDEQIDDLARKAEGRSGMGMTGYSRAFARLIESAALLAWLRGIDADGYRTDDERFASRILLRIAQTDFKE